MSEIQRFHTLVVPAALDTIEVYQKSVELDDMEFSLRNTHPGWLCTAPHGLNSLLHHNQWAYAWRGTHNA